MATHKPNAPSEKNLTRHRLIGPIKPYGADASTVFRFEPIQGTTQPGMPLQPESFAHYFQPNLAETPPNPVPALPYFRDGDALSAEQLNQLTAAIAALSSHVGSTTSAPIFHKRIVKQDNSLVFTLMPFTAGWSDYVWRREIKVIVESIPGYSLVCLRADDLYGTDVLQDIYESIAKAQIVIADITDRNANVFYELGLAHALGKEVILLAQGTQHIPFDLLRFRHCIYSNDGPGYEVLRTYLNAAIRSILVPKDKRTRRGTRTKRNKK